MYIYLDVFNQIISVLKKFSFLLIDIGAQKIISFRF